MNLLGSGAPMIVAVFCIPIPHSRVGQERFGVLTLSGHWIGYASLFDLGLGRALTATGGKKIGDREEKEIPSLPGRLFY